METRNPTSETRMNTCGMNALSPFSRPACGPIGEQARRLHGRIESVPIPGSNRFHRNAFSFAEVMFAVVILGIGFILIAAIFPVAIQQSQATSEESNAANLARSAGPGIESLLTTIPNPNYSSSAIIQAANPAASVQTRLVFPPTVKNYVLGTGIGLPYIQTTAAGTVGGITQSIAQLAVAPRAIVVPFVGSRWDLVKAGAILPSDPRFAFAAFYKRENNSSSAELIVISMIVRNRPTYSPDVDEVSPMQSTVSVSTTPGDFPMTGGGTPPTAGPYTTICPDVITVSSGSPQEGNFVTTPNVAVGNANTPLDRTYTLGQSTSQSPNGPTFELVPGDAMALTAGSNGLWGTAGRIADPALANQSVTLNSTGTLQATVAYATLWPDPDAPGGRIWLTTYPTSMIPPGANNPQPAAAAPGAFVIVADDCPNPTNSGPDYQLPPNIPGFFSVGSCNGRIFRLGKVLTEDFNEQKAFPPGWFDLDPQYGMRPPPQVPGGPSVSPDVLPNPYTAYSQAAKVYIIGAGTTVGGSGPTASQDIGVFATYFQVQ